ncbi:chymotrypsin inhibitor-like isoform X1 [Teleopsis dalmanni]|uniref:chymotrypsin inhibitor-like n=1 Tax=Teleopsis dalmanni TaxID=139649 RepID=UPI0018CD613A|nr:chymotrypsin inhibitor-like [Teleopsis dalmanni]XP_037944078.1 chymotrypsin inhibitor-like isoform X1 [Teleopsis dalmanni]
MLYGKFSFVILLLGAFLAVNAQNEECGPNEEYTWCGSACPETCNSDPMRMCTMQCVIGCVCKDGFVKGNDGKCIPKSSC